MTEQQPALITPREAAERFGKSLETVRNWYRSGAIRRYYQELGKRVYVDANEIARKLAALPSDEPDGQA